LTDYEQSFALTGLELNGSMRARKHAVNE
jgi:hypothetical protein